MQRTAETVAIERELSIAARPETVWEFLVDPEKAARWMGQEVALEPRPGGVYRVNVIPGSVALGEFVEVDPQRHAHGWDHYLERLVIAARGGDPGPDPWVTGEM
jgi:uncharacterized protein YndB with AHSA1/START domain